MAIEWRFLDTGRRSAAENMALDEVLLECRSNGSAPNTIRLLRFNRPAVLVGYHQDVGHEVRLDYVRKRGMEINRRLTGGGAIYFDRSSLGWEVIASKSPTFFRHEEFFRAMCEGPVRALKSLGIQATFRPKNDIEVNGRKISGTGGTDRDNAFLFQGTLLVDFDVEEMIRALRIPIVKLKDKELRSAKERVTCVKWELGYLPSYAAIKEALKSGFEQAFKIELAEGYLTPHEEKLLGESLPRFQSDEWIFHVRRPLNEAVTVHAVDKKPGGLVRVSIALDVGTNLIKSILITGDFFVFPSKAIPDLEAALKFTRCDEESVRKIVQNFFVINRVHMPGITPDGIVDLILEAIDKVSYRSLGITPAETNHLYPITKDAKSVLDGGCDLLLLPYCAKLPSCEFRRIEGCEKCGGCSIGWAYEFSEAVGLKTFTIQNFEHLISTLRMMKERGAKGWIGCCCEAFYCKHRDEMEEVGLPGIVVDIEDQTCYDLGKMEEAYRGDFESQTRLKTGLLSKLLNRIERVNRKTRTR